MTERRSRLIVSWIFLVLFCLTAPLALVAGWARMSLLTVGDYVATVGELAADPAVQESVANAIAARVGESMRGENPTATEAVLAGAAASNIADAARAVVANTQFAEVWGEDIRALHAFLTAGSDAPRAAPAVLDLSPLLPLLLREFAQRQIALPEGVSLRPEDLQITLFAGQLADRVRQFVHRIDTAAWVFLVVTIGSLVLSVALAAERIAALERAGFGLAIAMVILIALLIIFPTWFANSVETGGAIVGEILDAISQSLRLTAVGLAFVGLVLGSAFAGLRALRRGMTPRRRALE